MDKDYWYLAITRDEYLEIYKGTSLVKDIHLFETPPKSDEDMILNYMPCKLWRLNNSYTIRDKVGTPLRFNLHRAQHVVYANSIRHPRLIILKSRQQGISTLWLISFFDDAIFLDNMSCGLMAQGADAATDLLERIDYAWEDLDSSIKNLLGIHRTVNNSKETAFSNGSKMYVRTSFRSGTLTRLHISELGKIANKTPDRAKETNTGSLQAIKVGNTVIIESTAEGKDNLFASKWYDAESHIGTRSLMHFMPVFLSWVDDPDCVLDVPVHSTAEDLDYIAMVERDMLITLTEEQKWWACAKRKELGDDFGQEYPYNPESAFAQARDGSYYGKLMKELRDKGRIVDGGLFEPELKVTVTFDLGINDEFVMLFWQSDTSSLGKLQIRLIDSYINSGEGLAHYVGVLRDRNYRYERFVLPHDAKKRELGSATSIAKQLRDLGLNKQKVLPREEILPGIQAVREMMPLLWIDSSIGHNDYVIKGFDNYTKEWNDRLGVWRDKPLHNEWSNPMDAVRYYAMFRVRDINAIDGYRRKKKKKNSVSNVVSGLAM